MEFGLNDEQCQLKESARAFLARECPASKVRQVMAAEAGIAGDLYADIAKLGWMGLVVPEEFGGSGLGMLDMCVLLEECGYAALPGPFLFSAVLATSALLHGGRHELKERWLPLLSTGEASGSVALVEANDNLNPVHFSTNARNTDGGWLLNGAKMFVPYAHVADFLVVAALTSSKHVGMFVVERNSPGVRVKMLKNLDLTRRVSIVQFENVKVPPQARLDGGLGLYHTLCNIGAVAVAADSLGGTERVLEMAVEYSKVREQFGRPIGSFQALKHAAAEMAADLEPARALLWYAAHAQNVLPDEAARAAAMAKTRLSEVYTTAAEKAVLMHGGIGFTWEHDMHLWFKRARFNESYFGSPQFHRERLAELSGY
jgi:alkylation response protein AidB-like acyl-CoA dehydrogenase